MEDLESDHLTISELSDGILEIDVHIGDICAHIRIDDLYNWVKKAKEEYDLNQQTKTKQLDNNS
jgi:hypothetical protein